MSSGFARFSAAAMSFRRFLLACSRGMSVGRERQPGQALQALGLRIQLRDLRLDVRAHPDDEELAVVDPAPRARHRVEHEAGGKFVELRGCEPDEFLPAVLTPLLADEPDELADGAGKLLELRSLHLGAQPRYRLGELAAEPLVNRGPNLRLVGAVFQQGGRRGARHEEPARPGHIGVRCLDRW